MKLSDIKKIAHSILENQNVENSFIEYKKSINFKDKILKTACAFANNYMNNEINFLFIGVEEVDNKENGEPRSKIDSLTFRNTLEKNFKKIKEIVFDAE